MKGMEESNNTKDAPDVGFSLFSVLPDIAAASPGFSAVGAAASNFLAASAPFIGSPLSSSHAPPIATRSPQHSPIVAFWAFPRGSFHSNNALSQIHLTTVPSLNHLWYSQPLATMLFLLVHCSERMVQ